MTACERRGDRWRATPSATPAIPLPRRASHQVLERAVGAKWTWSSKMHHLDPTSLHVFCHPFPLFELGPTFRALGVGESTSTLPEKGGPQERWRGRECALMSNASGRF